MPELITSIEEIEQNLSLFEKYLCGEVSPDAQKFACKRVKMGTNFIAYTIDSEWRFAPSRYVGYANNSIKAHNDNQNKNGGSTDAAIDKALGDCTQDDELENKYRAFCIKLEIVCNEKQRQYWRFNIKGVDFKQNSNSDDGFPEGKEDEKLHKKRERSAKLIRLAKETFLKNHEKLYCMVCEFDFEAFYGERGQGYIEAHHTIPVSEMKEGDKTKVKDIALVCANCHRMLHRTPWLTIDELKKLLKK
ncbi:MAG: HNH endonuclease [Methylococcales bacterium]